MNQIKTLKFSPKIVNGDFICSSNQLTTLKFSPKIVNGIFSCSNNPLTSLKFSPKVVKRYYNCSKTPLTSIKELLSVNIGEDIYIPSHLKDSKENKLLSKIKNLDNDITIWTL